MAESGQRNSLLAICAYNQDNDAITQLQIGEAPQGVASVWDPLKMTPERAVPFIEHAQPQDIPRHIQRALFCVPVAHHATL